MLLFFLISPLRDPKAGRKRRAILDALEGKGEAVIVCRLLEPLDAAIDRIPGSNFIVFLFLAGAFVAIWLWHLLATERADHLPPEFRFRFWSPKSRAGAIIFYGVIGLVWPISLLAMSVWFGGWFVAVGGMSLVVDICRWVAICDRPVAIDSVSTTLVEGGG